MTKSQLRPQMLLPLSLSSCVGTLTTVRHVRRRSQTGFLRMSRPSKSYRLPCPLASERTRCCQYLPIKTSHPTSCAAAGIVHHQDRSNRCLKTRGASRICPIAFVDRNRYLHTNQHHRHGNNRDYQLQWSSWIPTKILVKTPIAANSKFFRNCSKLLEYFTSLLCNARKMPWKSWIGC